MPKSFSFTAPAIPSVGVYYFLSGEEIEYEVRFGRKQSDVLAVNIVFGVINEEYDGEEYVLTNKNEFYAVMQTIMEIIEDFMSKNPNIHLFEFAGEPAGEETGGKDATKRTKIYLRYAHRVFKTTDWNITRTGNKVSIERRTNR